MLGIGLLLLAIGLYLTHSYFYALLLFFGFVTNGYQLIPPALLMAGAPTDKLTDLALVFLLVALVSRSRMLWWSIRRDQLFRWIGIFIGFIALDGLYSIWSEGYELGGVLRVFRVNLFLLSFGVFFIVPTPVLMRLFHTIAVITVIQSVIFLFQLVIGQALLNSTMAGSEVATTTVEKFAFTRFYNTPVFLTPTVFYYLFQFRCRSRAIHWGVLGILLVTVIAPLHRNYIFGIVVMSSLYVLFQQTRSQRAFYISLLVVIGYGVSTVDMISYRINEGLTDFNKTFTTGQSLATTDYGENTFAFRMAHLFERINYITAKPGGYVFGIGLLSENTRQAEQLSFEVGAFDERTGRISQINTGDIAWSLLILQLGFVGTILFIIVLVKFIRLFYRHRLVPFSVVGLLSVSVTFLISFAGTELLMIPFRTLIVFLAVIVTKAAYSSPIRTIQQRSDSPDLTQAQPLEIEPAW
jgi:hypothetical protein